MPLATRLAEAGFRVALIEAGKQVEGMDTVDMAGLLYHNFGTEVDWQLKTEPEPGLNGRVVPVPRGKYLGGTSNCNGTLVIRGCAADYDQWANEFGCEGWAWKDVLPFFQRAETFHPAQNSLETREGDDGAFTSHGTQGPLHTSIHEYAPISERFRENFEGLGLPYIPDLFANGGGPFGVGHAARTIYRGKRTTAADYIRDQKPATLTLLTETYVRRVVFEDKRAVGVEVSDKEGSVYLVKAAHEVLLTAGAYMSPHILQCSGVGDRTELTEHDIDCVSDLPGVGKNLMDHLITLLFFECTEPGLTSDQALYGPGAMERALAQWKEDQTGVLASVPHGIFSYLRLDKELSKHKVWRDACEEAERARGNGKDAMNLGPLQPHVEIWNCEAYGGSEVFTDFPDSDHSVIALFVELFSPRSRGTVTLRSGDAAAPPVIRHNYMTDPVDAVVFGEACRWGKDMIFNGKGTKNIVAGSWPSTATHHTHETVEEWTRYARDNATTCYHPAGTCRMGPRSMEGTVVDTQLRVYGVSGLRVVDTSVMPQLINGHTQMPAYMIAEKCAQMIIDGKR